MSSSVSHGKLTPAAGVSAVFSAVVAWAWLASAQGKAYLMLAVLWCCGSDKNEASIILNHNPSIIAALACGVTVGCFITALWLVFQPGEKDRDHVKYDILHDNR
ncbi:hypothetical protein CDEF62S_00034 [Castellaniella defragrans]